MVLNQKLRFDRTTDPSSFGTWFAGHGVVKAERVGLEWKE
jgi:hypothetical protein